MSQGELLSRQNDACRLGEEHSFFTQAIDLDPAYARAYGDLSRSYFYLGLFEIGPPGDVFPKAKANAAKALELDETVASAHNALAAVHIFYDWDWAATEAESMVLYRARRYDESILQCRKAPEIDPQYANAL